MRVFFLGNNWLGLNVLEYLKKSGEEIIGMAIHPQEKLRYGDEIRSVAGLPEDRIFDGSKMNEPDVIEAVRALKPDIGVSAMFAYILRQPFLDIFPEGCINLHPSYLPYNRGAHPNIWSIIEGTPSGVTLHRIDTGVDTGPILAQQMVDVEPVDTGKTLYTKLESAALDLFVETWPRIRDGIVQPITQSYNEGTHHRIADVQGIDHIDLDKMYQADDLINILRARTFPPYTGAYFLTKDGRKVFMRLELNYEDDRKSDG